VRWNPLQGLGELARERGVRGIWFAAFARLGYRRVIVREFTLDHDVAEVTTGVPVTVEQLQENQADEFNVFRAPADRQAAARQLADGHRCFVARHDGVIVSACWVATGQYWNAYLSRMIPLAPDEFYLYGLYTRPDFRGQGLTDAIRREIFRFHRSRGFQRVVTHVIPENRRALSRAFGFRTTGVIGCLRIGRLRRDFMRMYPR
jgi:GNAT superfamily N-acetyltransferase